MFNRLSYSDQMNNKDQKTILKVDFIVAKRKDRYKRTVLTNRQRHKNSLSWGKCSPSYASNH